MNLNQYTFIVFGVEHYNPLGVIRSLGEYGIKPIAIVIKNKIKITSKSRFISKLFLVDSIEEGYQILLTQYGNTKEKKTFLYSCDDKIETFLDAHYEELKNKFYFFNAGKKGKIAYYMNKENIARIGIKYGLNVLPIYVTKKGVIPDELEYPVITKAIASTVGAWKDDVFICHSQKELITAFAKIQSPIVLLQKYIKKKNEYCIEGISVAQGKEIFLAILSTYNYLLPESYSPYMTVQNFDNLKLQEKLSKLFEDIGFEGIYEVEFLIDQNDKLYFSEINFRNSTWSYAATCAGMNLPVLWAKSMLNGKIVEDSYKKIPKEFTAMVETNDFKVRVCGKKIGFFKWLKDFKNSNCRYYLGKKDIKPLFWNLYTRVFH